MLRQNLPSNVLKSEDDAADESGGLAAIQWFRQQLAFHNLEPGMLLLRLRFVGPQSDQVELATLATRGIPA